MKSNSWNKSEYVTFIGIALLSFVWRVRPSDKIRGQAARLWFPCPYTIISIGDVQYLFQCLESYQDIGQSPAHLLLMMYPHEKNTNHSDRWCLIIFLEFSGK